jgi:hypothetical protein
MSSAAPWTASYGPSRRVHNPRRSLAESAGGRKLNGEFTGLQHIPCYKQAGGIMQTTAMKTYLHCVLGIAAIAGIFAIPGEILHWLFGRGSEARRAQAAHS